MGGYGALKFGTQFTETKAIFAYAPAFRLDHPYSRSALRMENRYLKEEVSLAIPLKNSAARIYAFLPCYDHQDGVNIMDALGIEKGSSKGSFVYLNCEHDVNSYLPLPELVNYFLKNSQLPEDLIAPLRASTYEINISIASYMLYCREHGIKNETAYEDLPIELTNNWRYFYWKARDLARQRKKWESIYNFIAAMERGGHKSSDLHFCLGNSYKDLKLAQSALGHYHEAAKLKPNNATILKAIRELQG